MSKVRSDAFNCFFGAVKITEGVEDAHYRAQTGAVGAYARPFMIEMERPPASTPPATVEFDVAVRVSQASDGREVTDVGMFRAPNVVELGDASQGLSSPDANASRVKFTVELSPSKELGKRSLRVASPVPKWGK